VFIEFASVFLLANAALFLHKTTMLYSDSLSFLSLKDSRIILFIKFLLLAFLTLFFAIASPSFAFEYGFFFAKTVKKPSVVLFALLKTLLYSTAVFSLFSFGKLLLSLVLRLINELDL
jgi:hypothetical protein